MLYFNRKKAILLISHFGCNAFDFYNMLLCHNRINGYFNIVPERAVNYNDPNCLYLFKKKNHSWPNKDKIYLDLLFFNYQIGCNQLYKNPDVEFLFYLGNGIKVLEKINQQTGLSLDVAKRYYCFRLRRICEMICKVKKPKIFIEGISDGEKIFKHLNNEYKFFPPFDFKINYEKDTQGIPEECFERYYSFIIKMKERNNVVLF
jgi:hypothetical protein